MNLKLEISDIPLLRETIKHEINYWSVSSRFESLNKHAKKRVESLKRIMSELEKL